MVFPGDEDLGVGGLSALDVVLAGGDCVPVVGGGGEAAAAADCGGGGGDHVWGLSVLFEGAEFDFSGGGGEGGDGDG